MIERLICCQVSPKTPDNYPGFIGNVFLLMKVLGHCDVLVADAMLIAFLS